MLRLSFLSFGTGVLALILGIYHLGGLSFELGRLLLFIFVGVAMATFVLSLLKKVAPTFW